MPYEFVGLRETPEELETRRRASTRKRVQSLAVICALSIGARLLIKDPPPPKGPDRSHRTIRYIPGMLEDIPLSQLSKMDPKIVSAMRAAEAKYKQEKYLTSSHLVKGVYKPMDVPLELNADLEALKQAEYLYAKRQLNRLREEKVRLSQDIRKPILIRFRSGGFIKAENTHPLPRAVQIQVDRTLFATVPKGIVASVTDDARTWKEKIPAGFIQLQPAKGITITVARETAKRITVRKLITDET